VFRLRSVDVGQRLMDSVRLGFDPGTLTVYLTPWGDFWAELDRIDPATGDFLAWDDGTGIELHFFASLTETEPEAVWAASISGYQATWHVPKAQVITDALDPVNDTVRLIYLPAAGGELLWEEGATR
jgi:hypothetical protein